MIWFSASEAKSLPGLPTERANVRRIAERENWESRDRVGRGGGKEYLIPDRYRTNEFLAAARAKFPDKFGVLIDQETRAETVDLVHLPEIKTAKLADLEEAPQAQELTPTEDKASLQIWARIEIVRHWQNYVIGKAAQGMKEVEASSGFCEALINHTLEIPDWIYDGLATRKGKLKVSRASLQIWKKLTAAELAPKYKGKEGQDFFGTRPEYREVLDALSQEFGAQTNKLHFAFAGGLVKSQFGLEEIPSYAQIDAYLKREKASNVQRARAFATGDMSILRAAQGSYSRGLFPNDKWEADSTKADVWLVSPHGDTMTRWSLVVNLDVATRRVKILVLPYSNGEAITQIVAKSITEWGLAQSVKTDNGKDYVGRTVQGFLRAVGSEQVLCTPKQPWQKPHVERFMRSIQHSKEWELLPWGTGHSVAQQQAKRKITEGSLILGWTADRFQEWLDRWVDNYHNQTHEGLGCTPNERLAAFRADGWKGLMPKNLDKNLEFSLMREELATVQKKGIRYENRFYLASELQTMVGSKLAIRIDQNNPNQILVYDSPNLTTAKLICVAIWDMALTPQEQIRIATAKPIIDQALAEHEQSVKKKRKAISKSLQKNPEQLLPERGGVGIIQAFKTIDAPAQTLIQQIEAATAQPVRSEQKILQLVEMRKEFEAKDAIEAAKPKPINLDQVVRDCISLWEQNREIPEEMAENFTHYVMLPEGFGSLKVLADFETWKPMYAWAQKKWAAINSAAS